MSTYPTTTETKQAKQAKQAKQEGAIDMYETVLKTETASPSSTNTKNIRVVALPERFDAFASTDLATDKDTNLVVDGRSVKFADLHALQSLVDARLIALDCGSEILISSPSNEFRAILDLTGFVDLLHVLAPSPPKGSGVTKLALSGDLGPKDAEALRTQLANVSAQRRPQIVIDLSNVGTIHLGVANVLVVAREQALSRFGDVTVIARPGSPAEQLLAKVGIVRGMRP